MKSLFPNTYTGITHAWGMVEHPGISSSGKLLSPWAWKDKGEEMVIVDHGTDCRYRRGVTKQEL